jgi:hypothetical protein
MLPVVVGMNPARVCIIVVLPQPEGPTTQMKSPAPKARSTESRARIGPSRDG